MKYNPQKRWSVDIAVTSDNALSAAEAEYCVAELRKAIGEHGGIDYTTDEHRCHAIAVFADEHADLKAIMQIVAVMCSEGCTAVCWDGHEREDYLLNFAYRLRHCND